MNTITFKFEKTITQLLKEIAAGAYIGETLTVTEDFRIEVVAPNRVEFWICGEVLEVNPKEIETGKGSNLEGNQKADSTSKGLSE
jgi:hypothetical protein